MRAELHCHSCHSKRGKLVWDGIPTPSEIIRHAKKIGIDAIAITDHDSSACWKEASVEAKKQGIIFIRAAEISTLSGHVLGIGLNELVPMDLSLEETVEHVRKQGAIAVASHPYDIKFEGIRDEVCAVDAMEIWNGFNLDRKSNRISTRVAEKIGKPACVGSDAHTLDMMGSGINIMDAHDEESILRCIRTGKVQFSVREIPISTIVEWTWDRFALSYDSTARYIDANYNPIKGWVSKRLIDKFVRSEHPGSRMIWRSLAGLGISSSRLYGSVRLGIKGSSLL